MLLIWTVYVLFPALDYILPPNNWNPESKEENDALEKDLRYLIPLYYTFFADFMIYFKALYLSAYSPLYQSLPRFTMLALATSQQAVLNVVVGHELFHRR
jgi:hypothetical protein